ncbi:archease [Frigoriglobus tundricola]|uniref:Archease n=1 Tax=Frigoriglobus tundricola TaxID=2774151 RepID=A0A6M5Z5E0_9BACT|nr:archease [Frigoriglobus tundricola]QJX00473.1 Archease [Frigoriglobus tundricola]
MHELYEHTADLGLRATAPDLATLFAEMARCLVSAMVEDPTAVRPTTEMRYAISCADRELLLADWLRELLRLFEEEHLLLATFDVKVGDSGLMASLWGETYDPERHALAHEVKAITYHELKVVEHAGGWLAEVIVDI